MPHALIINIAHDHEALKRFQKDRAVLEIPQREFRDDTLMHAHLIALEQIDQNRPHPRRPTRLQVLRQVPVPQDRLRRLRTAVRPQDLALGHPEPGRRVGVSDELRQARHLHHQPPLPGGAAGEDGRGVAGAPWGATARRLIRPWTACSQRVRGDVRRRSVPRSRSS